MEYLRMKMDGKLVKMIPSENYISKSSIRSAFLLHDDSIVSLSYMLGEDEYFCLCEPSRDGFQLPETYPTLSFIVKSKCKMPTSESILDTAPKCETFSKWMFYLFDEEFGKSTVICVHPRFFVTFRQRRGHSKFKLEDELIIYSAGKEIDEQEGHRVTVYFIEEKLDYIVMRSEVEIVTATSPLPWNDLPSIVAAKSSEPITIAGFEDKTGKYSSVSGIIHREYATNIADTGFCLLGTGPTANYGSVVWSARGLIGMIIGETTAKTPQNIICEASNFKKVFMNVLWEEFLKKTPKKEMTWCTFYDGKIYPAASESRIIEATRK